VRVFSDVELCCSVSQGGFAKCYLGTAIPSKQQYALKIVLKSTLSKPKAKQKVSLSFFVVNESACALRLTRLLLAAAIRDTNPPLTQPHRSSPL
jgi:hypothetical protein